MDPEQQSNSIDQLQSQAMHYAQTSEFESEVSQDLVSPECFVVEKDKNVFGMCSSKQFTRISPWAAPVTMPDSLSNATAQGSWNVANDTGT